MNREAAVKAALDKVDMNNGYIYADDARKMLEDFYDQIMRDARLTITREAIKRGW